ncbi:hypothetical protein VP01_10233g1, partial [Puccinia sorghi]
LEKDTPTNDNNNIFEFFNAPPNSAESRKLEVYFKNMDCLATPAAKDQKILLIYSESSCAADQTFSSAANVCSSGRGSLKPKTIGRCVSSHMWLKQGIQ